VDRIPSDQFPNYFGYSIRHPALKKTFEGPCKLHFWEQNPLPTQTNPAPLHLRNTLLPKLSEREAEALAATDGFAEEASATL